MLNTTTVDKNQARVDAVDVAEKYLPHSGTSLCDLLDAIDDQSGSLQSARRAHAGVAGCRRHRGRAEQYQPGSGEPDTFIARTHWSRAEPPTLRQQSSEARCAARKGGSKQPSWHGRHRPNHNLSTASTPDDRPTQIHASRRKFQGFPRGVENMIRSEESVSPFLDVRWSVQRFLWLLSISTIQITNPLAQAAPDRRSSLLAT